MSIGTDAFGAGYFGQYAASLNASVQVSGVSCHGTVGQVTVETTAMLLGGSPYHRIRPIPYDMKKKRRKQEAELLAMLV